MDISTNTIVNVNAPTQKFSDPNITAKGEVRAHIDFNGLQTLWFNTGSLCNIECVNCYIKSSPTADHFVYLTPEDMAPFLDEIDALGYGKVEIGFTGGEPYLNPYIFRLCEMALERGHTLLVLTNAMKPMMRPRAQQSILDLQARFGNALTLRVSLDHYTALHHDEERGTGSFDIAVNGMNWLSQHDVSLNIAGRTMWGEDDASARNAFAELIAKNNWKIDAQDPATLILFPEMDETIDVPEVTNACWGILNVSPDAMMCSSSRMVVKNKGSTRANVLACTLLWDDPQFDMGPTLEGARKPVKLNHPHCSKFCVFGGASCSA